MISFTTRTLITEAARRGIHIEVIDEAVGPLLLVTIPGHAPQYWYSCVTAASSGVGVAVNRNKLATYHVAARLGIPTGAFQIYDADHPDKAEAFFAELREAGHTAVVKPVNTDHAIGVTVQIADTTALREAIAYARSYSSKILIQQYKQGEDCRFTVVDGVCVAAVRRMPPAVVGDGHRTVRELVNSENERRSLEQHEDMLLRQIKPADVSRFLGEEAMSNIPVAGERVQLIGTANFGRGGETEDITDTAHPSYKQAAVAMTQTLNLGICGVDFISTDYTQPLTPETALLLEINCAIGLRLHHFPTYGTPRNVAGAIVDAFVKYNKKSSMQGHEYHSLSSSSQKEIVT